MGQSPVDVFEKVGIEERNSKQSTNSANLG
jgi:hypothetical protein